MGQLSYLDFDLLIDQGKVGYRAQVLSAPAGTERATAEFALPFDEKDIKILLLSMGHARRSATRRLESPQTEEAKRFGGKLFEAVFNKDVWVCLRQSMEAAQRQDAGLRIRLQLTRDAQDLADLPWEYLYDQELNRFLALSADTPITRYLALPEPPRPLTVQPPLRVLVMISSPSDYATLDVEREWAVLQESLADLQRSGLVIAERLEQPSLAALQRRLRRGQYHVLHFIGHGAFDEASQDGVILLEDEAGRGRPVSGQDLGMLLHDHRPLRLAIINACEGARSSRADPFAGTAQSLVQQGVPAVIAMQFEISDEAAIAFSHEFYGALVDGYPVDGALAEARKSIFSRVADVEWGTPVLFMRSPDGRIFDVAATAPAPSAALSSAPEPPVAQPASAQASEMPRSAQLVTPAGQPAAVVSADPGSRDISDSTTTDRKKAEPAMRSAAATVSAPAAAPVAATPVAVSADTEAEKVPAPGAPAARARKKTLMAVVIGVLLVALAGGAYGVLAANRPARGNAGTELAAAPPALTANAALVTPTDAIVGGGGSLPSATPSLAQAAPPTVAALADTATPEPVSPTPSATLAPPTSTATETAVPETPTSTPAPTDTPTPTPAPTNTRPPAPTRTSTAPTAPAVPGLVTGFEPLGRWVIGKQPYGTLVQSTAEAHSGRASARFDYNFPATRDNFVVFSARPPLSLAGKPSALTIWVLGDGSGHYLNVWIRDSKGETRQFTFGRVPAAGAWQQLTAVLDTTVGWPQGSVGGPDNGVLDYPISLAAIVLDAIGPDDVPYRGTIYLDDIMVAPGQ